MKYSVFCALLLPCFVLVYCDAKKIPSDNVELLPEPKTWSLFSNPPSNKPTEDQPDQQISEGIEENATVEAETFRPLVLNLNSTFENFQLPPNKYFLEWISNIWNLGNNNQDSDNTNNSSNSPIVQKDCSTCKCGITNTLQRIVGGVVTKVNQWPWVVALKHNNDFYCGGSVVSSRYVLTAAHCTVGVAKERMLAVFLEHDRFDPSESKTFTRKIINILRHARYNANAHYNNDLSLLKLAEPLSFNDKFRPVCLPGLEHNYAGSVGTVTGWGATSEYSATSSVLREVNVPIMSNDDCRKTEYGNKITMNMLCAGFVGKGGKDACQGDSGGPIHVANGTKYMIVGIVSWGEGCAEKEYPGVYTRVNRYISWIKANTKDSCYCS